MVKRMPNHHVKSLDEGTEGTWPVRIGVVGCGQWGRNHARTLDRMGVLGGVADLDPERAAAVAVATHTEAVPVERLLADPDIDGIVLALPPMFHPAHARAAIDQGKGVLIEKPMALDLADAAEIVSRARARGVVAMTGHVLRFHPAFEALIGMARAGELGRIHHIETVRIGLGRSHPGSDAVMDLFPHDLSMILALADIQPGAGAVSRAVLQAPATEAAAVMRLGFAGGLTTLSRASNTSPSRERTLALRCDAGLFVFDDIQPWGRKLAMLEPGAAEPRYLELPEREPLAEELRHFVEGIAGAPVQRGTAEEGLRVLRTIALCARRGARPGAAARLPAEQAERRVG